MEVWSRLDGDAFAAELTRLGHPDPDTAASQLLVLVDGTLAHAVTRPDAQPARAARTMAELVFG